MARFAGIPSVPEGVAGEWQSTILQSLKENVEALTGQRGDRALGSRAVVRDDIRVQNISEQVFTGLTARGDGFTITIPSGDTVQTPALEDYTRLVNDVTILGEEVRLLRSTLNFLIAELKR